MITELNTNAHPGFKIVKKTEICINGGRCDLEGKCQNQRGVYIVIVV